MSRAGEIEFSDYNGIKWKVWLEILSNCVSFDEMRTVGGEEPSHFNLTWRDGGRESTLWIQPCRPPCERHVRTRHRGACLLSQHWQYRGREVTINSG